MELVYVSDWGKHSVSVFNGEGSFVTSFGCKGMEVGQFNSPSGLAFDEDGFLYVCDLNSSLVHIAIVKATVASLPCTVIIIIVHTVNMMFCSHTDLFLYITATSLSIIITSSVAIRNLAVMR